MLQAKPLGFSDFLTILRIPLDTPSIALEKNIAWLDKQKLTIKVQRQMIDGFHSCQQV